MTVATDGTSDPGTTQHVHADAWVAIGLPCTNTVALPLVIRPTCSGGARNGSVGCRPTCGGVLRPDEPRAATNLPPAFTDVERFCVSGAPKGSGAGDGIGAPSGPGTRWFGQRPVMRSFMTITGAPIS